MIDEHPSPIGALRLSARSLPVRSDHLPGRAVDVAVDPRSRRLPARAMLDVERWMTRHAMDDALDTLCIAADREFQLGLLELEVATASYTEHVALTLAGFCLARNDIPAALAVLRGWSRNPRRLP